MKETALHTAFNGFFFLEFSEVIYEATYQLIDRPNTIPFKTKQNKTTQHKEPNKSQQQQHQQSLKWRPPLTLIQQASTARNKTAGCGIRETHSPLSRNSRTRRRRMSTPNCWIRPRPHNPRSVVVVVEYVLVVFHFLVWFFMCGRIF